MGHSLKGSRSKVDNTFDDWVLVFFEMEIFLSYNQFMDEDKLPTKSVVFLTCEIVLQIGDCSKCSS